MLANLGRQCRSRLIRSLGSNSPHSVCTNRVSTTARPRVAKSLAIRWINTAPSSPTPPSNPTIPLPSKDISASNDLKLACEKGNVRRAQECLTEIIQAKALESRHLKQILKLFITKRNWRLASEACDIMLQHRMWPHPTILEDLIRLLSRGDLTRAYQVLQSYPTKDDSAHLLSLVRLLKVEGKLPELVELSRTLDDSRLDVKTGIITAILDIHARKRNPRPIHRHPKVLAEVSGSQAEIANAAKAVEEQAVQHALSEMRRLQIKPTSVMFEKSIRLVKDWNEALEIIRLSTQVMDLPVRPGLINRMIQHSEGDIELAFMIFGIGRLFSLQESWVTFASLFEVILQHPDATKRVKLGLIVFYEHARLIEREVIDTDRPEISLLPLRRTVSQMASLIKQVYPDYHESSLQKYIDTSNENNISRLEAPQLVDAIQAWTEHVFGSTDAIAERFTDLLKLKKVKADIARTLSTDSE